VSPHKLNCKQTRVTSREATRRYNIVRRNVNLKLNGK